ncbi:MAG: lipocalin family protein [Candidatus Marinimicrobia bacterium]|nr:lipocalin family protein [Candidatus Neomarinimicrobiota bacterium]
MKKPLLLLIVTILLFTGGYALDLNDFSYSMDAINQVELEKYLGTWYEYARLDVSFERGMFNTQANYTLLDPDCKGRTKIRVINSGVKNSKPKKAKGRAIIPNAEEPGRLMVSFFGPFYGDYNIIALDTENYQWAMVAGGSTKYLWILTREKELDPKVLETLKLKAQQYGFDTDALIYPQK